MNWVCENMEKWTFLCIYEGVDVWTVSSFWYMMCQFWLWVQAWVQLVEVIGVNIQIYVFFSFRSLFFSQSGLFKLKMTTFLPLGSFITTSIKMYHYGWTLQLRLYHLRKSCVFPKTFCLSSRLINFTELDNFAML